MNRICRVFIRERGSNIFHSRTNRLEIAVNDPKDLMPSARKLEMIVRENKIYQNPRDNYHKRKSKWKFEEKQLRERFRVKRFVKKMIAESIIQKEEGY